MLSIFNSAAMPERPQDQLMIIDAEIRRLENSAPPNGDYTYANLQLRRLEQAREKFTKLVEFD